MIHPRRRASDKIPWGNRPNTILYAILLLVILATMSVFYSSQSARTSQRVREDNAKLAAISAARNQVQILRHRVRSETNGDCIANYIAEIITARSRGIDLATVPICPRQNIPVLERALLDAEKSLEKLSPNDPLLATLQNEHGVDSTSTTTP